MNLRPCGQSKLRFTGMVGAEVILNQNPTFGGKLGDDFFQQLNVRNSIPPWAENESCLSGSRFKSAMNP